MKTRPFLLILLVAFSCIPDSKHSALIKGEWIKVSTELIEGEYTIEPFEDANPAADTVNVESEKKQSDYRLRFEESQKLKHLSGSIVIDETTYTITGDNLLFSGLQYEIVQLNQDSLVLKEEGLLGQRVMTYRRVE